MEYAYDDLYRLDNFKYNGSSERTYGYDDNGNLTTFTGKTLTYGNDNNQLTNDGSRSFNFDAAGRASTVGIAILAYDIFNNMTGYANNYYSYDAFNQRIRKRISGSNKYYITSGAKILAEYTSNAYPDAEYIYANGRMVAALQTEDDNATRLPVTLKAISKGFDDGNDVELFVDGVDEALTGRGYSLVVVDEGSGEVLDKAKYDTHGSSTAADDMADFIDDITLGRIVLVGIMDEGTNNMTENAFLALESLGSGLCREIGYRASHDFIGRKGAQPGSVVEIHSPQYSGPATAELHVVDVRVQSAGNDDGGFVNLLVSGIDQAANYRGHTVVVVDESDGAVLNTNNYDTYASSTAADAMATFINGLPSGRVVLVGIADEGSTSTSENAYVALESLGSDKTRDVGYRDSWGMVGVKGASIGSAAEIHVPRYQGYADIESAAPSVYFVDRYRFFFQDHLGSTRQMSDSDMLRDYYPYGENKAAAGNEETVYQFTGKELDSEIGLHYFGARFYDASIGRWLAPDPAGQGFSPYAYAGNSPLVMVDPDGEFFGPIMVAALFAGAYGAGTAYIDHNSISGGFLSGAIGGAIGAGIPANGLLPSIGVGALSGGVSGGINSSFNGGNIGLGFKRGAIIGGSMGGIVETLNYLGGGSSAKYANDTGDGVESPQGVADIEGWDTVALHEMGVSGGESGRDQLKRIVDNKTTFQIYKDTSAGTGHGKFSKYSSFWNWFKGNYTPTIKLNESAIFDMNYKIGDFYGTVRTPMDKAVQTIFHESGHLFGIGIYTPSQIGHTIGLYHKVYDGNIGRLTLNFMRKFNKNKY